MRDLKNSMNVTDHMIRFNMPAMNPGGKFVMVFDPSIMEAIFRNEGPYPYRGGSFDSVRVIRERRPDIFGETVGAFIEEGPKWLEVRRKIQQDMMRPKSAMFYVNDTQRVAKDFVQYVRRIRDEKMVNSNEDFLDSFHKYAFEAISLIAINTRMGCFDENPDPVMLHKLEVGQQMISLFPKLMFSVPTWNYSPPRWNPIFRQVEDLFGEYADFIHEKVQAAVAKIKEKVNDEEVDLEELSVLEKLIIKNGPNSAIPFVNAFDMIIAGIDTTGNTLGFLLYNLARNPQVQENLRAEVMQFGDDLTEKDLAKMKYFRLCLKESFRVTPTVGGNSRILPNDTNRDSGPGHGLRQR